VIQVIKAQMRSGSGIGCWPPWQRSACWWLPAAPPTTRIRRSTEDAAAELDSVVERGAERAAAGGLVVRVDAPAGQRTTAAGPADVDGEDELTGDEAVRIGSITKLFTPPWPLQLAEEGVIDLDAPTTDLPPTRAADLEHDEQTNGGARGVAGDPPRKE
jgi:CubicO group peptidase (beta-lactamase class C family)